jgi:hypothetical protein
LYKYVKRNDYETAKHEDRLIGVVLAKRQAALKIINGGFRLSCLPIPFISAPPKPRRKSAPALGRINSLL